MKNKTSLSVKSIFLICSIFFISFHSNGQETQRQVTQKKQLEQIKKNKIVKPLEISKSQKSTVSENTIYIVNNKIISNRRLKLIPKDSILSLQFVRRDTIIKGLKFDSQIFVTLIANKKE